MRLDLDNILLVNEYPVVGGEYRVINTPTFPKWEMTNKVEICGTCCMSPIFPAFETLLPQKLR
jgi:hypothetical protein